MTEPPTTIQDREKEIEDEFLLFDDWMGRYEHLIEMGKALPPMAPEYKTDEFKIRGCQSQVWIMPERRNGRIHFEGDSDALITKGLVALLIRVLDGQPAAEVANTDLAFLDRIGMTEHLSPTRKNGLASMVDQMKRFGAAFSRQD